MKRTSPTLFLLVAAIAAVRAAPQEPAAAPAGPGAARVDPLAAIEARIRTTLEEHRARFGFPGASAAFVLGDGRLGAVTVGVSDRETKRPLATTDRLMSGSIGKTYVSAVALQLVAEEKLDLDAKIAEWLGAEEWFGRLPNAKDITVRMLMRHQSGIPEHVRLPSFAAANLRDPDRVWRPEEMIAFIFDAEPLFPAGEGWSYADTNYIVLGMILERIEGKPYYRMLEERILAPLGLEDTVPTDRRAVPGLVSGHTTGELLTEVSGPTVIDGRYVINPQFEWTGGGLACTTSDLARWCALLYGGKAFPDSQMQQLLDGVPARTGHGDRYGLGVQILETAHGPSHGHSGIMPGYLSMMAHYPKLGAAIAIQFNTDDLRGELGRRLRVYVDELAAIVADELGKASKEQDNAKREVCCPAPRPRPAATSPNRAGALVRALARAVGERERADHGKASARSTAIAGMTRHVTRSRSSANRR